MKEIEYGEFLRLDSGKIVRYGDKQDIRVENNRYIDYSGEYEWETRIVNHSSNIIDLIEVGDYVNGYKVKYVCNEEPCPSGKYVDVDCELDSSESYFFENQIKSIVTKEQFANAEYRLED